MKIMDKNLCEKSLRTGIDEVDSQHQTLLEYLNDCMQKTAFSKDVKDVVYIYVLLNKLTTCADTHFKSEEGLMQSINYPEFERHQQQHDLFKEQVARLERAVSSGEKPVIAYLAAFLRDWYIKHILEHDKRIGVYMNASGSTCCMLTKR